MFLFTELYSNTFTHSKIVLLITTQFNIFRIRFSIYNSFRITITIGILNLIWLVRLRMTTFYHLYFFQLPRRLGRCSRRCHAKAPKLGLLLILDSLSSFRALCVALLKQPEAFMLNINKHINHANTSTYLLFKWFEL